MITLVEGRKAYNQLRVGSPETALEVHKMKDHEAAVAAFLAECEVERPAETARVFAKYPVLTDRQLDDRRKRELYAFGNELDGDEDGAAGDSGQAESVHGEGLTLASSIRVHNALVERQEEARRRGEPVPDVISSWTW